jgi:hypothetical protein
MGFVIWIHHSRVLRGEAMRFPFLSSSAPKVQALLLPSKRRAIKRGNPGRFFQWKRWIFLLGIRASAVPGTHALNRNLRQRTAHAQPRPSTPRPPSARAREAHAGASAAVSAVEDRHVGPQEDIAEDPEGSCRRRHVQGPEP